jgi:triacylglycerol lipase
MPVLLVHGIWDSGARFDKLRAELERRGLGPTLAIDLVPNDGSARMSELAGQIGGAAQELLQRAQSSSIDVVGFSMGALAARYWIQRAGGRRLVRKFVAVSGPQSGTLMAYARGLAGVREMRPGSALLTGLNAEPDPFGAVEVHTLRTPFDLMIIPSHSSRLAGAEEHVLPVLLHRFMITSTRAVGTIARILEGTGASTRPPAPRAQEGGGSSLGLG